MLTRSDVQSKYIPFIEAYGDRDEISSRTDASFLPMDYFRIEAVEEDRRLQEVFGAEYPKFMDIQRPGQTDEQQNYRKDLFEKLGNPLSGIESMIERQTDKVFTSDGFHLKFNTQEKLASVFENYITKQYWNGNSFLESFKQAIKRKINLEPNSLLAIIPNEIKQGELPKPYFSFIPAKNILYYKANTIAIFKSELKQKFDKEYLPKLDLEDPLYRQEEGNVWYIFTEDKYCRIAHVGYEGGKMMYDVNFIGENTVRHGCSFMPVIKIGRKLKQFSEDGSELRESDISGAVTSLSNALLNYLDHLIELNFHSASQEYVMGVAKCKSCRGTGRVSDQTDLTKKKPCEKCSGGWVSPFNGDGLDRLVIPPVIDDEGSGTTIAIDPKKSMGYIERPTHGEKSFKENFHDNVAMAISPLGIGHLLNTPYNQSGEAKDKDMSEGYAYCQAIANHVGELLKFAIESMACLMFKSNDKFDLSKVVPNITTPNSFNLEGYNTLLKRLSDASQYSLPSFVIDKLEADLIEKEYGVSSMEYRKYIVKKSIDPLPNSSRNEKVISRSYLDDESYILTTRFENILNKTISTNKDFLFLDVEEQERILRDEASRMLSISKENLEKTVVLKPNVNIINEDQTQ